MATTYSFIMKRPPTRRATKDSGTALVQRVTERNNRPIITSSLFLDKTNNQNNLLINPPSTGPDRLYTSESDVCRRQILTCKDDPRTKRIKICIMTVDP